MYGCFILEELSCSTSPHLQVVFRRVQIRGSNLCQYDHNKGVRYCQYELCITFFMN